MTLQELYDVWERYMHRADLTFDLATVKTLIDEKITGALMIDSPDLADILANWPRMYVHGGLAFLHELAQDDEGLSREVQRFNEAMADYSFRNSINQGRVRESNPWYREPITWA